MRKLTEEEEDYLRDNLRYDPETGHLWWTKPLNRRRIDKPAGYVHNIKGYVCLNLTLTDGQFACGAHRVAWFLHYGVWPKDMIDHINGVRYDNRISNLREATNRENQSNSRKLANCSSQYKGVSFNKGQQKWQSRVKVNEKNLYLGGYTSEEEAARAYDKAAREIFGDYACLNFPDEHEQGALNGHDV